MEFHLVYHICLKEVWILKKSICIFFRFAWELYKESYGDLGKVHRLLFLQKKKHRWSRCFFQLFEISTAPLRLRRGRGAMQGTPKAFCGFTAHPQGPGSIAITNILAGAYMCLVHLPWRTDLFPETKSCKAIKKHKITKNKIKDIIFEKEKLNKIID